MRWNDVLKDTQNLDCDETEHQQEKAERKMKMRMLKQARHTWWTVKTLSCLGQSIHNEVIRARAKAKERRNVELFKHQAEECTQWSTPPVSHLGTYPGGPW